jgi:hypothetical protein
MLVKGHFPGPFRPVDRGEIRDLVAHFFRCSGIAIHRSDLNRVDSTLSTGVTDEGLSTERLIPSGLWGLFLPRARVR